MDHLAGSLIVMKDGPKGATGGDESHNTKRPMERVLENDSTFIQESLPGYKVEGIVHVNLHDSKVIIVPVSLHACSKAMNDHFSSAGQATPN